jgi:hypothetical protein
VVPIKYDGAREFSEGLAAVGIENTKRRFGNRMGYIDRSGRIVIPVRYYSADSFSEGMAAVQLKYNGPWGFIDKSGKLVIPSRYDYAWEFSEGLAAVVLNGKVGYIDRRGKIVIPAKYKPPAVYDGSPCSFSDGLAYVETQEGYIGRDGTEYFEP